MRTLFKGEWRDTPLDYAQHESESVVRVVVFINLLDIGNAYFTRASSWRLIWNYIREIGVKPTLTKILSRRAEKHRNDKYLSVGFGYLLDHTPVYFIAPLHPACVDILPLANGLIYPAQGVLPPFVSQLQPDSIYYARSGPDPSSEYAQLRELTELAGWHSDSGSVLPSIDWQKILSLITRSSLGSCLCFSAPPRDICRISKTQQEFTGSFQATLFGLGNYAKTVILPNLPKRLRVTRVHEIDPLQISGDTIGKYICSSQPVIEDDDNNRVFLIAGFHHTHAALACEGLKRNASVVVEKPLVTTRLQLVELEHAFRLSNGRYFACFHKRYQKFNQFVRDDLNIGPLDPINYHALVYEVPLPGKHWYRWPNSCSRLVSNGCHWVDHFLFLNNFSAVHRYAVFCAQDGALNLSVTLQNGALFTLVLTEKGSHRLGVQDHVQLRQHNAAISIENGARYCAERDDRVVRTLNLGRMHSYRSMYRTIGEAILNNQPGDSWASIAASSALVLSLEEALLVGSP